ncbi:hypothetical protein [Bdellovibrio sp. HCB2-146]|uniref:hypothetical protein n=1 Tax=Bdellovibrio sp. HCB2-146 TaxID=3394362 RepID=UPI0039BD91FC
MTSSREMTKKKMTKPEYDLFLGSFPDQSGKMSEEKINMALHKVEALVMKYRRSAKKNAGGKREKLIEFRLRTLERVRDRYYKKVHGKSRPKPSVKESRSLTAQPKMLVPLKDNPRDQFLRQARKKIYESEGLGLRKANAFRATAATRIAGTVKSRDRKAQVARDRKKAARERAQEV